MKTMKKLLAVLLAVTCLTMFMTGCSFSNTATGNRPVAVAFVVSVHANSEGLNLDTDFITKLLLRVIGMYDQGYITVIGVTGDPFVILEGNCDIQESLKHGTPDRLKEDNLERVESIMNKIRNTKANTSEVDTLRALQLAVRSLNCAPQNAEKIIVVVDTGLCTTGILNFQNNLLANTDDNAIADALYEKHEIPDMTGITVRWQQMGDVAAPQAELSQRQRDKLESIWRTIIEKGGGKYEPLDDLPVDNIYTDMPPVTPVKLDAEEAISFSPEEIRNESFNFEEPVFLHEEQVQFVGDSDQYVNPGKAEETILPISEYMLSHEDFQILLVGTTAGDGMSEYCLSLSEKRAKAVKSTLVSQGVPEENIYVLGLGSSDPWHIYGVGTGSDKLASQNRKVVLLSANSETGKELLK